MRTTVRLDDQLMAAAKRYAAETGRTLTALIEDALREVLSRRTQSPKKKAVRLNTVGGTGLQAGVDLDDSASLVDIMAGDGK